jgi:E3 ubiquitin-protein ligase HERC3
MHARAIFLWVMLLNGWVSEGWAAPVKVLKISSGDYHSCGITDRFVEGRTKKRELRCWGSNVCGQVGVRDSRYSPVEKHAAIATVGFGEREVVDVAASRGSTCVILSDGTIECFGRDFTTTCQPGDVYPPKFQIEHNIQIDLQGDKPVAIFAANSKVGGPSSDEFCATTNSDRVHCWVASDVVPWYRLRLNEEYQGRFFDPNEGGPATRVVRFGGELRDFSMSEIGHYCGVLANQKIKCFEYYNNFRAWGVSDKDEFERAKEQFRTANQQKHYPRKLDLTADIWALNFPEKATSVAVGLHANCATFEDGSARCWGDTDHRFPIATKLPWYSLGQLPSNPGFFNPEAMSDRSGKLYVVKSARQRITKAYSDGLHTLCFQLSPGSDDLHSNLKCVDAGYDQLSEEAKLGANWIDEVPWQVTNLPVLDYQITGGNSRCALYQNGGVKCWGDNFEQSLGYGTRELRIPVDSAETPLPYLEF